MLSPRPLVLTALVAAACGGPPPSGDRDVRSSDLLADPVVARWSGGQVTLSELESMLADQLRQLDIQYKVDRYERLHAALDGLVHDALIDAEVARRGLESREALFAAEVDGRLAEPTEEELRAEFEALAHQVPDATFQSARPFLRRQLLDARRKQRHEQLLRELREQAGLAVELRFPDIPRVEVPVRDHDPTLGDEDAPLTVVQFGGFQCYYCKRVHQVLEQLMEAYPGQIRLVFKDFPLTGHARARSAAVAAHCAGQQGRYWEMSAVLLDNQGRLEDDHLAGYARALGLDVDTWSACTRDPAWPRRIDDDVLLGRELGVSSTPTFFFNGLMVTGAHPYDRLAALVEQELATVAR